MSATDAQELGEVEPLSISCSKRGELSVPESCCLESQREAPGSVDRKDSLSSEFLQKQGADEYTCRPSTCSGLVTAAPVLICWIFVVL